MNNNRNGILTFCNRAKPVAFEKVVQELSAVDMLAHQVLVVLFDLDIQANFGLGINIARLVLVEHPDVFYQLGQRHDVEPIVKHW